MRSAGVVVQSNTNPSERNPEVVPLPTTCGVVVNAGPAAVITRKSTLNGPTVKVAVVTVSRFAEAVWRTQTVWLLAIVPAILVKLAVQPIEYVPPTTLIGIGPLMPLMVMVFEVRTLLTGTFPWVVSSVNVLGVVSQSIVVTLKLRGAPAIVTVAVVVVPQLAEAVCRSAKD